MLPGFLPQELVMCLVLIFLMVILNSEVDQFNSVLIEFFHYMRLLAYFQEKSEPCSE